MSSELKSQSGLPATSKAAGESARLKGPRLHRTIAWEAREVDLRATEEGSFGQAVLAAPLRAGR
jgi:hypothetical protein